MLINRTVLALVLVLVLATAGAHAEVVYTLAVNPVLSPSSGTADVRVILEDYAEPRPFSLQLDGSPFTPPPDTRVTVLVSHLRSTFTAVGLSGLEGELSSPEGTTLFANLTGTFSVLLGPPPGTVGGVFVAIGTALPLGSSVVTVIGPSRQVETIYGRWELAGSSLSHPPPPSAVLLGLGLGGLAVARVYGWA